ncbi:hypothetical protein, partial [Streptomyces misionensis]|uniref:hypothetical protein n=1 Tax=Streptomyces misionensis TaxID=67331 RepID=UPI00367C0045
MTRRALPVLLLTLLSAALLAAHLSFGSDSYRDCAYVGPSIRMYLTSWAGLACALGALAGGGRPPPAAHPRDGGRAGGGRREGERAARSAHTCRSHTPR